MALIFFIHFVQADRMLRSWSSATHAVDSPGVEPDFAVLSGDLNFRVAFDGE